MRKINPDDLWLAPWCETPRDNKWYRYYPGDICKIDPFSKSKPANKIRGRECEILWIAHKLEKVGIKYLDTGKEGLAIAHDLIVIKRRAVDFTKYRETGEHSLTDHGIQPSAVKPHWQH